MISNFGKNQLAQALINKVESVLLNGSISIDEFALIEIDNNDLIIDFDIPPEVIELTHFVILDVDKKELASASVFVPRDSDTRFRYRLTITGGRA